MQTTIREERGGDDEGTVLDEAKVVLLMNDTPRITDAAKNLLSEEAARGIVDPAHALAAVQVVLKALRTVELLDFVAWGKLNPQPEGQSGLERIDELATYKAALALWRRARTANQSPGKLLGRTFLRAVWTQIREHAALEGSSSDPTQREVLEIVLGAFDASLRSKERDPTDVVWASDLSAVLALRRQQRDAKVAERLQNMEADAKRAMVEMIQED